MKIVSFDEFKEYFEREVELLPFVSNHIKEFGRLPESIPVSNLDFRMLRKVLNVDEEFFGNLKTGELTDAVWEKMTILNPEEYWEIAPKGIADSKNIVLDSVKYNTQCVKYFSKKQVFSLIEIIASERSSMNYTKFLKKFAVKEIVDVIIEKQNVEFLIELFGTGIFETDMGIYIFETNFSVLKIVDDSIKLKMPSTYYDSVFEKNMTYIQFFPKKYQTEEKWEKAVNKIPKLIKSVPDEYLNQNFCKKVSKSNPKVIKHMSKQFISKEMCEDAYKQNKSLIIDFPEEFITNDMIQDTINTKGNINDIIGLAQKRGLMTSENFKTIVGYSLKYLSKIDKEYYDRESLETLLKSDKWTGVLASMDITYFDYDLLYKCATHSLKILKRLLPHEHINKLMDEKILEIYLTSDYIRLDLISDKFLTIDVLRIALEKNNDALSTLPEERRTSERYRIAVEYGYCDSNAPLFIKNQLKEKQLKKTIHRS